MDTRNTNQLKLTGEVIRKFEFHHEIYGEKFYVSDLRVPRVNNNADIIPLLVSDRLMDMSEDWVGNKIKITGQFRSYNLKDGNPNRLFLFAFPLNVELAETSENDPYDPESNCIQLDGYLCKTPVYRKTPLGREIADLLFAVNRPYGKSDYIPCICWGKNARYITRFNAGDHFRFEGRIQSREYLKTLNDGSTENRIAYEVSVSKIEYLEEENSR